ncbi:MAG: M23 family metallopeptidase [Alphaproteobacteria bacterium]|nr:M23 family metallopeptidase [Alphaproteobacteria bacterium]MBV9061669.1 M23 family metallopeptidase [Alphaproteobacteria bacterium]
MLHRSSLALSCLLVFSGVEAQATTYHRLPLPYIPWPISAWMDHSAGHTLTGIVIDGVDIRYDGTYISSGSSYFHDGHRGTDFALPEGNVVYASASGTVVYTNTSCPDKIQPSCGGGLGNWVAIRHPDGKVSIYGHLVRVDVSVGQVITCVNGPSGFQVGLSGISGNSTGPHLHFELRSGTRGGDVSYDPFAGPYSQSLEYWYRYALVNDPLHPGQKMHYPAATCQ